MKRLQLTPIVLVAAALAGVVILYAPYLSTRWSMSPYGDTIYLTGPLFCEISRSVQAGVTPLMNWSTFEAIDYNPHVAPYYPFYLFGWLDFCSAQAAAQAADIIMAVHVAIFAITTASLIRATGVGLVAAIGGGAVAATLPNTYTIALFPTFIAAAAWLPLGVEGLVRLYYCRQHALGGLLLAAGTSAMLTAGPGTNLLSALVLIGLVMTVDTVARLVSSKERAEAARLGIALVVAGLMTALLSLGSTINLYSHLGEIIRWTRTGAVIGRAGAANTTEILTEQLGWHDLPQLLAPLNVNYAVGYYLIGPSATLLALFGAVRGWSKPPVRIFATLVIVSVVLVFLSPSWLVRLWAIIPGLSHTRHLSLVATPLAIGVSVLAGHGLAGLAQGSQEPRQSFWLSIASLTVLIASLVALLTFVPLRNFDPPWYLALVAILSAVLFAIILWVKPVPLRSLGAAILLVLQFAFIAGSMPRDSGTPAVVETELWRSIETALDHIRTADPEPGRVAMHSSIAGGDLTYMNAGTAVTYMGLTTFSHYTSPRIYWKFVHEVGLVGDSNFGLFGGKYLLSSVPLPNTLGNEVFRTGDIRVTLLNRRRPLVATICLQPDELAEPGIAGLKVPKGQLPLLRSPLDQTIARFEDGRKDCPADSSWPAPRIDREDNGVDFSIPPGQQRLLVISMPPYTSWQLWAGGRKLPLYNLREQQVVAFVPPGISGPATLIYRPTAYGWLVHISEIGWAILILAIVGLLAWQWRRSREPLCV